LTATMIKGGWWRLYPALSWLWLAILFRCIRAAEFPSDTIWDMLAVTFIAQLVLSMMGCFNLLVLSLQFPRVSRFIEN
jgi:hypothetical protein